LPDTLHNKAVDAIRLLSEISDLITLHAAASEESALGEETTKQLNEECTNLTEYFAKCFQEASNVQ
jgi:hypothetical protein